MSEKGGKHFFGSYPFLHKRTLEISPALCDHDEVGWLSAARCSLHHLRGGHSISCLRIHYLFVYRSQLPVLPFDVIWAIFSYSLFSLSSYCSPILFFAKKCFSPFPYSLFFFLHLI